MLHPATFILPHSLAGYTRSHPATFILHLCLAGYIRPHSKPHGCFSNKKASQYWTCSNGTVISFDAEGKALTILFWGHHREKGAHMHNMPKPDNYATVHIQLPNLDVLLNTQMCPIFICCCTRIHKCLKPYMPLNMHTH